MSVIGNTPTQQSFLPAIEYFNGNGSTTAFTLSRNVVSAAQIMVYIENVPQNPSSAFTVSGNTITFTSAPPTGTSNIWVEYVAINTSSVSPTDGTVQTNSLATSAVTTTKIADANVTQAKLAAGVAGNGPAFSAYLSANQGLSAATHTKVLFNTEEFDTNSNYDNATNYRFTPTVAGYYQINLGINFAPSSNISSAIASIYKNGALAKRNDQIVTSNGTNWSGLSALIFMNGTTDYLEGYAWGNTSPTIGGSSSQTYFQASMVRAA